MNGDCPFSMYNFKKIDFLINKIFFENKQDFPTIDFTRKFKKMSKVPTSMDINLMLDFFLSDQLFMCNQLPDE